MEIYHKNEAALIAELSRLKETEVDFGFINSFRPQLIAKVAAEAPRGQLIWMPSLKLAGVIAALLVAILSTGSGAVVAAQKIDLLYRIKLSLASGIDRANLRVDFVEKMPLADKNPQVVIENLEKLEKELLGAHNDLNGARSSVGNGEKLAASAINIEKKIVAIKKNLDELRDGLGDLAHQPKIAEALAKATLAADMGLERSADAIIEGSLKANKNFASNDVLKHVLDELDSRIAHIRELLAESFADANASSAFIAPETVPAEFGPVWDKVNQAENLASDLKASLNASSSLESVPFLKRIRSLEDMIEDLEAEIEK